MNQLKNSDFFLPYNPDLTQRAREMRKNPTPAESKLWNLLKSHPPFGRSEFRVWRQRPINHFIKKNGFETPSFRRALHLDPNT
ncbi:DUF559 domain-containing protein [Synechocystis sp. B12]|nr:DUF559 domain-containing protein [Synechocystis sp. B12]